MGTITIKINERNSLGKAIKKLIESSAKESSAVEIIEPPKSNKYKKEFVKKILDADIHDKRIRINTSRLWENI